MSTIGTGIVNEYASSLSRKLTKFSVNELPTKLMFTNITCILGKNIPSSSKANPSAGVVCKVVVSELISVYLRASMGAAKLWNSIDPKIRNLKSLNQFKTKYKFLLLNDVAILKLGERFNL